jgi:hypothetical protein
MDDVIIPETLLTSAPKATLRTQAAAIPEEKEVVPYYLPPDIVGGSLPYIFGHEDEAVWNAASQACGTDNLCYAYTIDQERIWYLATPASSLTSNPDSWCPLVAALPGNSEYWDRETVYIFEQEGTAAGLRWDQETSRMQVFVGPSRTVLPRLQTLDANFVTINPERAVPIKWKHRALAEEKLARSLTYWLFWSGAAVTLMALAVWLLTHVVGIVLQPNLQAAQKETARATEQLMAQAAQVIRNDSDKHLFRLQELLLSLQNIGGTLMRYEVTGGKIVWEALVPSAVGSESLKQFKARVVGTNPDGRVRVQGVS